MAGFSFFGEGLPGIDPAKLGQIDRSTRDRRCRPFYPHRFVETMAGKSRPCGFGHRHDRSALAGKRLKQAKEGHTLAALP